MTFSKGLSYNEMRILWNEGEFAAFEGVNGRAWFFGDSRERWAVVRDELSDTGLDAHDTFNSFWLVWGNWQEYKLVE